jgi:hypothetical protein
MNYYINGDAANADKIKAAFMAKGFIVTQPDCVLENDKLLIFTHDGAVTSAFAYKFIVDIIKTHPDYKELELPVEPKFKAEDRIVSKSDKSTIYRIITLHEERREYVVEIEHKDYHESCPWIAFEDQDDYELAPKPHYDIANFYAGMPVLVRDYDNTQWRYVQFSHCVGKDNPIMFNACGNTWEQCIPFEGNEHLLGTTDMPSEEYINW